MSKFLEVILGTTSLAVLGFLMGLFTSSFVGYEAAKEVWIKAAIERGYGQYCPKDGAFAWKGECAE